MRKKRLGAFLLAAGMLFGAAGCNQELVPEAGTKIIPDEKNLQENENSAINNQENNIKSKSEDSGTDRQGNENDLSGSGNAAENQDLSSEKFQAAKDYKEIFEVLQQFGSSERWLTYSPIDFNATDGSIKSEGMAGGYGGALLLDDVAENVDYSVTNVQVEGIAESDIVKTDGRFLYILSRCEDGTPRIYILGIKDGAMEKVSSFVLPQNGFVGSGEEMYLSGDTLVIVRQGFEYKQEETEENSNFPWIDNDWGWYRRSEEKTQILIYNIEDRTSPKLAAEHKQDGRQISSREKDGYLYVISEKGNYHYWLMDDLQFDIEEDQDSAKDTKKPENGAEETDKSEDTKKAEEVKNRVDKSDVRTDQRVSSNDIELTAQEKENLPKINDCVFPAESIYYSKESESNVYTIITSIRLDQPDTVVDSISIMTSSNHCYVSNNAIYLTNYLWRLKSESTETALLKIDYMDGNFKLSAQGIVKGVLDDQFSVDEKNGYLRLVTTVDQYRQVNENNYLEEYLGTTNSLYVLDKNLQVVGMLEGLAEEERIYSARFIGDIAYFVTYRNTDPLFSVDLSNPTSPKLLGALKIPGFSDYLHPFGDHLLLGIGYDTGEDGQGDSKIKLTMFDITNPSNVTEKHTLILDCYEFSEACYNHKSVLIDAAKNIIGFPAQGYGRMNDSGKWDAVQTKAYLVYGYREETGFYQKLERKYIWKYSDDFRRVVPLDTASNNIDKQDVFISEYRRDTWYDIQLRGLYIGDYFYVINTLQEVVSYQRKEGTEQWKKTGEILELE